MKSLILIAGGLFVVAGGLFLVPAIEQTPRAVAQNVPKGPLQDCCGTGKPMLLQGGTNFYEAQNAEIAGAENSTLFREEVFGRDFSVVVPGLSAGKYTVEIQFAESFLTGPNMRVMNITVGEQKLAENFDIFAQAGGANKVTTVSGVVTHEADTIRGPLTVHFKAVTENAKFNFIRIIDEKGTIISSAYASQLHQDQIQLGSKIPVVTKPSIVFDATKPRAARIADLISRMSLNEKVAQLQNSAPAIERLNIPSYNYWSEALHGVARNGHATVFPQAIGLAATWDVDLMGRVADTISTEGRAKYVEAQSRNQHGDNKGLTFWAPNINIFRDPRWGRGQETYGEDPFLTSRMAVAFIRGMQGDDPNYLKTIACAKHFAVHSGPEPLRHVFNALPPAQDLYDTYLPAFEAAVREGHVMSVMSAYNAIDGVPAPANNLLIKQILRGKWGFKGHVVSDCGAIGDVWSGHKYVPSSQAAGAVSIKAGTDLECGGDYRNLVGAVAQGLVSEKEIDVALTRVLDARFELGMFDPPAKVKWTKIGTTDYDTPLNSQLALQAARNSLVLLKNEGVLPLDKTKIKKLAVIGDNADTVSMQNGNYNGEPSHPITILQGLKDKLGADNVIYVPGCRLAMKPGEIIDQKSDEFHRAIAAAQGADAVIYVGGLNPGLEGEEMRVTYEGFNGGDRTTIELPAGQHAMLQALQATGKPVVFVNCSGSAVAMPWEADNIPAILQAWYPGQAGGTAVADVLFGDFNPAGRLPFTIYRSTADLPAFTDYSMKGRTYRYFTGKPLWAFGHGLSYTQFSYGTPTKMDKVKGTSNITLQLPVKNTGSRAGDEVAQVYARPLFTDARQPLRRLIGFTRVSIGAGQTRPVALHIPAERLRVWDSKKNDYQVVPGQYELAIGAASDDARVKLNVSVTR
ncbi:xylan 1,4-beta-xylosidase [Abditibacteriota bacterium]|nr:xylan 1,4-beta-xylosidase [Abditibacteriota bacterium]